MKRYLLRMIACVLFALLFSAPICSTAEEGILYHEDFESGSMDGWVSYEEKSAIAETEDGHVYHVCSYDYNSKTASFSDYDFTFRMKIDYKEGASAPSFYLRRGADGSRYEAYIDSAAGKLVLERVVNEEKSPVGELNADFAADNNQWVSMRFVLSGKNIWVYYKDMGNPAVKLRDETALTVGGIGFGFGNADFYVDDIVISELSEPLPEPYEINPEEAKDYLGHAFYEEIDQLMAFGIVNAYDDGSFRPERPVTRAEFAALVVRAGNVGGSLSGSASFSDVSAEDWFAPYAAAVCAMGYMTGVGNGSFAPNEPITMEQAAKVLVCLLGAEVLGERRGGYPLGYLAYAAQRGIGKGVTKQSGEALTRAEVAKLLADTIKLDMLQQTGFGAAEEYREDKGETILSQYHDIYPYKGRVTANYFAGIISDERLGKNEIMLGNAKMDIGDTNAQSLLGYYVSAYVKETEAAQPEIIWICADEKKSDAIKIAAEDIIDVSGLERISYRDSETGKTVSASLSKNTNLILNGGSGSFTEENMKPQNGVVTLFDTDSDGVYETVLSENYRTLVVGSVSSRLQKIYDRYDSSNLLDVSGRDTELEIYRGYQKISFDEIAPLDVLSIAETETRAVHKRIRVLVSEKKIQGKTAEYSFDGEEGYVTVKGKRYRVGEYWQTNAEQGRVQALRVGVTATLYLDSFGRVAAAELLQASDFVLFNAVTWQKGADSCWIAEVFDSNGEWQRGKIASDVIYNGQRQSLTETNFPSELRSRQIVKVKWNSKGVISSISTDGSGELERKRIYDDWPMEYISRTKSFDTDSYVDEQTLVFAVPYHTDERERYAATDYTYFKEGSTYRLWSYNEDKYEVADIILVFEKEDSGGNGKYARPFFFTKMIKALDASGNEVRKINGYRGGEEISFVLSEDAAADFDFGDSVILSQNGKGEVIACQYLYRISDGRKGSDNNEFGMSSDRVTVSGTVIDYDAASGRVLLDVGNGRRREKAFVIGNAKQVYCCESGRKKIITVSSDEICVGDFIVMDFSWNELRDIMIYR